MEIIMDKYQQVIIDYAANRVKLSVVSKKINSLFTNEKNEYEHIDLSEFRADWYADTDSWGQSPRWEGWVQALAVCEYTAVQYELAELFDERTEIKAEAGQLKRNMCAYGRALINKENK